jgi:hypothetical protein
VRRVFAPASGNKFRRMLAFTPIVRRLTVLTYVCEVEVRRDPAEA